MAKKDPKIAKREGKNKTTTSSAPKPTPIKQPDSNTSRLMPCGCKSEFQDKTYGAGIRVMNLTKNGELRCTVCSEIRRSPFSQDRPGQVTNQKS